MAFEWVHLTNIKGAKGDPGGPFNPVAIPAGSNLNTYKTTGWFYVRLTTDAATILNRPDGIGDGPFFLQVMSTPFGYYAQTFYGYSTGTAAGTFTRYVGNVTSGTWTSWKQLENDGAPGNAAGRRSMLVSAFKARRGGVIGTGGKPALALRFDHGVANFNTKVLPLLQKYNLPWSQAINPGTLADASNATTFAELQGLCIDNGGEVANHGRTHANAVGNGAIRIEIETSLDELNAGLPGLAIETWNPPGIGAGGFGGYSPMETPEQHWNTYAGQLVMSCHAGVSGYLPGLYRQLPADLPIGLAHGTMDAQTAATVEAWVRGAIGASSGLQLMLHPALVDTAGNMTTADVEQVFAYIALQRDLGLVEVLTPSGLLLANPGSDHRDNLLANGRFLEGFTSWSNSAGWATTTAGGVTYASTSTGTALTQAVSMSRKEPMLGSARELVYKVRATAGAVVRTNVTGAGVNSAKDHTIPASSAWVEVRKPVIVPANLTGSMTISVGRVSGGAVDITDIRLRTI